MAHRAPLSSKFAGVLRHARVGLAANVMCMLVNQFVMAVLLDQRTLTLSESLGLLEQSLSDGLISSQKADRTYLLLVTASNNVGTYSDIH